MPRLPAGADSGVRSGIRRESRTGLTLSCYSGPRREDLQFSHPDPRKMGIVGTLVTFGEYEQ
jgi:hypothetical protein